MAYGYVHERIDILGFLWWLGGMPDQTRIDDSGALSPEEGERGRISPLNPAAQGITQMVPQEFGEAHPVDLCQRDRLQQQIARQKEYLLAFDYDTLSLG